MKNRPTQRSRDVRQVPLDHLRPGGRPRTAPETGDTDAGTRNTRPEHAEGIEPAQPAEPATPGAGDADAVRGKATGSPAAIATRPHLEGSEQSPG